jgi:hypothetical protein
VANDTEDAFFSVLWLGVFGTLVVTLAVLAFVALPFALVGVAIAIAALAYFRSGSYREKKAREHTHQLFAAAKARFGEALDEESFLDGIRRLLPDLPDEVRTEFLTVALILYDREGFAELRPPPEICNSIEGARYRDYLSAQMAKDDRPSGAVATRCIGAALSFLAWKVPQIEGAGFTVPFVELVGIDGDDLEQFIDCFYDEDAKQIGLFRDLRAQFDRNLADVEVLPSAYKGPDLLDTYLKGTPLRDLFHVRLPFGLPLRTRYEHHWILAGTGHGKSQTIQHLLLQDFERVAEGEASVVVIDSQNKLINTITQMKAFAPGEPLHDRLVWIDPGDVEYPLSLNLFDAKLGRINTYSMRDRERLLNNLVEMYEFVFRSLLASEMTDRQATLFQFLTRLMIQVPDATVHTLVEFLAPDGFNKIAPHLPRLDATARNFFESDYKGGAYKDTQQQVRNRLFSILRSATFDRMFSAKENRIDLFHELSTAKIVLINTDKDLLKEGGSSFFGRFFIAMLVQAIEERSSHSDPLPTFLYFDEAEDYFDEQFPRMLSTVRKHNIGIVLAHQYLSQTSSPRLSAALMSNTSIKFVGGVSPQDARALAPSMDSTPEFIRAQPKGTFAAHIRGSTPRAVSLKVPFFEMENREAMTDVERQTVREVMRARYAVPLDQAVSGMVGDSDEPKAPEPEPTSDRPTRAADEDTEHIKSSDPALGESAPQSDTDPNRPAGGSPGDDDEIVPSDKL